MYVCMSSHRSKKSWASSPPLSGRRWACPRCAICLPRQDSAETSRWARSFASQRAAARSAPLPYCCYWGYWRCYYHYSYSMVHRLSIHIIYNFQICIHYACIYICFVYIFINAYIISTTFYSTKLQVSYAGFESHIVVPTNESSSAMSIAAIIDITIWLPAKMKLFKM